MLSDFREVGQNFLNLGRSERDVIADPDLARSFRAFWDFLMSPARQEELSALLQAAFGLSAVQSLAPDARLKRVHYGWLEADEHTQRTVALLSRELRRILDDQAWLENRRTLWPGGGGPGAAGRLDALGQVRRASLPRVIYTG